MLLVSVVITIVCCVISIKVIEWVRKYRLRKIIIDQIPGPPGYPILGNTLQFIGSPERLWNQLLNLGHTYHGIHRHWIVYIPVIGISDPEDTEILLSSSKHLTKSFIYDYLQPWLGTGLLTSTGSKWHRRRKILTPTFHFNILQQFMAVFVEESNHFVQELEAECEKPYTNIESLVTQFTLRTICETAMGVRLDSANKITKEYTDAVFRMGHIVITQLTYVWYALKVVFRLSPMYQEQKRLLTILHTFSTSVISKRKMNFMHSESSERHASKRLLPKRRLAMLDLLISAQNSGEPIDDEGIREEVDTFMFEGHDTTTSCISFMLLLLASHPDIQERVVQELQQVFGNSNRDPTFEDIQKLSYLELVLKESLRMYPSVPHISRVTEEDICTSTGYTIPAGTLVIIHIYNMHHDPRLYPDPEKFDPDRFLPENCQGRHPFAYIPFSGGPRNCIGQRFAMLEIKTVISTILRNYVLTPCEMPEGLTFTVHFTLKTKHEIRIKFKKRQIMS